ncbi:hypothetical protein F5Y06DRAFT_260004 [Hypoxylon sp. FL0890]|nr:hypothetical protein F5Y06DRAFT_260004 [Hypoxylon sp. FL0890]
MIELRMVIFTSVNLGHVALGQCPVNKGILLLTEQICIPTEQTANALCGMGNCQWIGHGLTMENASNPNLGHRARGMVMAIHRVVDVNMDNVLVDSRC